MEIILEYSGLVHFVTIISLLLLYVAATQVPVEDPGLRIVLRLTALAIPYSLYVLFTCDEDDPRSIEAEVVKKICMVLVFFAPASIALFIIQKYNLFS